jgi:hypothetical protein
MLIWSVITAGLWPFILHLSLATLAIAACLAWAWFMPVFRQTALWCAAAIFLTTSSYVVGVKDGAHRVKAEWDATIAKDKAAAAAAAKSADSLPTDDDSLRNDPNNRNR